VPLDQPAQPAQNFQGGSSDLRTSNPARYAQLYGGYVGQDGKWSPTDTSVQARGDEGEAFMGEPITDGPVITDGPSGATFDATLPMRSTLQTPSPGYQSPEPETIGPAGVEFNPDPSIFDLEPTTQDAGGYDALRGW